jgi:enediyne biosynthesis protein E4
MIHFHAAPIVAPARTVAPILLAAVLLLLSPAALAQGDAREGAPAETPAAQTIQVPPDPDVGVESLPARAEAQKKAAAETGVPGVAFGFTDRLPESGITFVHRIVDDAGRCFKPVHYDHGNGLAVADVDGDDLVDLYFVNQVGGNELWRNRGPQDGQARFEDITEMAGVGMDDVISVTASFGDSDGDGDPDLYVTTVDMGNRFFVNEGGGKFRDATADSGLGHKGHSSGALWLDYDRDGDLDLFLANVGQYTLPLEGRAGYHVGFEDAFDGHLYPRRYETSRLFENRGGNKFEDVTEARGLADTSWSGDAAFADLNRDGYPDLYLLNMQGDDHYYENQAGEGFRDRTGELFPKTPWGAMGVDFFDYDGDGRQDLIVTDMHSDMSDEVEPENETLKSDMQWTDQFLQGGGNNLFGNALYRQTADGRFEEVSDRVGVETYWPWGLSTGDLDADGHPDLFVANSMNFPYRYQPNSVLMNDGERFHERAFALGVEPRRDSATHTLWFEGECGAEAESVCPGSDRLQRLCGDRQGHLKVMAALGTRSSALVDLENDGDLDIVTNEFNSAPQVLVSDLAQEHEVRWLKVELVGSRSNRDGLGATVRVEAGDDAYTQLHDGKSGYLSQSSLPLYFGLGSHDRVSRLTVTWPSGTEQVVEGPVEIGRTLEIREPAPSSDEAPDETTDEETQR